MAEQQPTTAPVAAAATPEMPVALSPADVVQMIKTEAATNPEAAAELKKIEEVLRPASQITVAAAPDLAAAEVTNSQNGVAAANAVVNSVIDPSTGAVAGVSTASGVTVPSTKHVEKLMTQVAESAASANENPGAAVTPVSDASHVKNLLATLNNTTNTLAL